MGIIWRIEMVLLSTLAAFVILVHSEEKHRSDKQLIRHVREDFNQEYLTDEAAPSNPPLVIASEAHEVKLNDTRTNEYNVTRTGRKRKRPKITGHVSHKRHKDGHYHHSHHQKPYPKTLTLTNPNGTKKVILPELLIEHSEVILPEVIQKSQSIVPEVSQQPKMIIPEAIPQPQLFTPSDTMIQHEPKQYGSSWTYDEFQTEKTQPNPLTKLTSTRTTRSPSPPVTFKMPSTENLENVKNVYRAPIMRYHIRPKVAIKQEDVDDLYLYRDESESPGESEQFMTAELSQHRYLENTLGHRSHLSKIIDDDVHTSPRTDKLVLTTTITPKDDSIFVKKNGEHIVNKYPDPVTSKYPAKGDKKYENLGPVSKLENDTDNDEEEEDPFERVIWKNTKLIKGMPVTSKEVLTETSTSSSSEEDEDHPLGHHHIHNPSYVFLKKTDKSLFPHDKKLGLRYYITTDSGHKPPRPNPNKSTKKKMPTAYFEQANRFTPVPTEAYVPLRHKHFEYAELLTTGPSLDYSFYSNLIRKRRKTYPVPTEAYKLLRPKRTPDDEFSPYSKKAKDYEDDHSLYSDINRPPVEAVGVNFDLNIEKPYQKEYLKEYSSSEYPSAEITTSTELIENVHYQIGEEPVRITEERKHYADNPHHVDVNKRNITDSNHYEKIVEIPKHTSEKIIPDKIQISKDEQQPDTSDKQYNSRVKEYLEHANIQSLSELLQKHSMTLDDLLKGKKKLEFFNRSDFIKRSNSKDSFIDTAQNNTKSDQEISDNKPHKHLENGERRNRAQETSKVINHDFYVKDNHHTHKINHHSHHESSNKKQETKTEQTIIKPNITHEIDKHQGHRDYTEKIREKQEIHKHDLHEIRTKVKTSNHPHHHHKSHSHKQNTRNEQTIANLPGHHTTDMKHETDHHGTENHETRNTNKGHGDHNKSNDNEDENLHKHNETGRANVNTKLKTEIHHHHHEAHSHKHNTRNEKTIKKQPVFNSHGERLEIENHENSNKYQHHENKNRSENKDENLQKHSETEKTNLSESKFHENVSRDLVSDALNNFSTTSKAFPINEVLIKLHSNSTIERNNTKFKKKERTQNTKSNYHFNEDNVEKHPEIEQTTQNNSNKNIDENRYKNEDKLSNNFEDQITEEHSENREKSRKRKRFPNRRQRNKKINTTTKSPVEDQLNTSVSIHFAKDLNGWHEVTNILNTSTSNDENKRKKIETPTTTNNYEETTTHANEEESTSPETISTPIIQNKSDKRAIHKYNATSMRRAPTTKARRVKIRPLGLAMSTRAQKLLQTVSVTKENSNIPPTKQTSIAPLEKSSSISSELATKSTDLLPSITTLFSTRQTFSHEDSLTTTSKSIKSTTEETAKIEIQEILNDTRTSAKLSKILMERNMTLNELVEHRERGSSNVHLADIFHNSSKEPNPEPEPFLSKSLIEPISKETYPLRALLEANQHDPFNKATTTEISHTTLRYVPVIMNYKHNVNENGENVGIISIFQRMASKSHIYNSSVQTDSKGTPYITTIIGGDAHSIDEHSQQSHALSYNINDDPGPPVVTEIIISEEVIGKSNDATQMPIEVSTSVRDKKELVIDGDQLVITEDVKHLHDSDNNIASPTNENEVILTDSPKSTFAQSYSKSIFLAVASMMGVTTVIFLLTYATIKCIQERRSLKIKEKRNIPMPVFEIIKDNKSRNKQSLSPVISTSNIYSFTNSEPQNSGNETPEYEWENLRNPF